MFDLTTAQSLLQELVHHGATIARDEHSMRIVHHDKWTLLITTVNTISLFEKGDTIFTIELRDLERDLSEILVRAYHRQDVDPKDFEYL